MIPLLCGCECFCANDVPRPDGKLPDLVDLSVLLICSSCRAGYHVLTAGRPRRFVRGDQHDIRFLIDLPDYERRHRPGGWRRFVQWLRGG